ncbi:FtsB family cell division protein [Falsibacillus albus]|uniref:Septum formation initiator family protein n=1 Tax=Falsibacillus albus TaxID=2478915 RepID=A0A3L7JMI2_9BACI|nr:septum formation initiator family protein [Falsibacillus albus]RLQ91680.1 septum formation initiator family protein [Falsibacillus albus]
MGAKKRKVTSMQNSYVQQHEQKTQAASRQRKLLIRRLSLFAIVAAATAWFLITSLISQGSKLEEKKAERAKVEKQLAQLKKKESILKDQVVKLNDDDYIAKLARSQYFLSEKGEIIFHIPESKEDKDKE